MNRNVILSIGFVGIITSAVLLLHHNALLTAFVLILVAFLKNKVLPIKKELLWFMVISLGGTVVEIVLVNFGNTWVYLNPHFLGIPIFMPIFWGVIGTTAIPLYKGIVDISGKTNTN